MPRRIHDVPQGSDSGFVLAAFGGTLSRNLAKKIQNPHSLENQTQRVRHAVRNRWATFAPPAAERPVNPEDW